MLKLSDLALRPDIQVGPMLVSPSRRLVDGPGGSAHLQPLIMQVFLLLLDAKGKVVTRSQLFEDVWGGAMVGDDSLNRVITKIRRIAAEVAPGLFEVETIPRTGYRLTGEPFSDIESAGEVTRPAYLLSRRRLVAAGTVTATALGAGGLWWWTTRERVDPRFITLMERGEAALRLDEPSAKYFERAVSIEPRNAKAWGLLAYVLASGRTDGPSAVPGPTAQIAERAARNALAIDPNEPNALTAMIFIRGVTLDRIAHEREYRRILKIDPDNTLAMKSLGTLLHVVGRCGESLSLAERTIAIEPLAPDHQRRRAMALWIVGRTAEADRVCGRAMELWPAHRLVRLAQIMIYAFTGRPRAALALVEEEERKPILLSSAAASVWRTSLVALETRAPSAIAAARDANVEESKRTPAVAAWAILALSALGELDAAFDVANGLLLGRGPIIVRARPDAKEPRVNNGWRNSLGLFTPPAKAMRLDRRFRPLADGLGLTDYWRRRGIGPDAFLFKP